MGQYRVEYDEIAVMESRSLRRVDQVAVFDAIERHLMDQPARVSRHGTEKLAPPVLATYPLRVGDYRVFYDVIEESKTVFIVAIRFKGTMTIEDAAHGSGD